MAYRMITRLLIAVLLVLPGMALAVEPPDDAVKITKAEVTGVIEKNTIWPASLSPIRVTGQITVNAGVTLFIEPGTQLKAASGAVLVVNGTLVAEGAKGSPVIFTADAKEPKPGYWRGIRFGKDSSGILNNCVIEYAGNREKVALVCDAAEVKIRNTTISRCSGNGVNLRNAARVEMSACKFKECAGTPVVVEDVNALPALGDNSYEENGSQQIWLNGGKVTIERTLFAQSVPYHIVGNITIEKPGKITIAPGAVLKFSGGIQMILGGEATLEARGTKEKPILFTAITDDTALGDTNNDGDKTKPAPGIWRNIIFKKGSTATLEHCIIRYGGGRDTRALWVQGASPKLVNCEIAQCVGAAVAITAGSAPAIQGCKLTKNEYPIRFDDINCQPTFKTNDISGNKYDAVWVGTGKGLTGKLTLTNPGVPYHLSSHLRVHGGAELILQEGVVLKNQPGGTIAVQGALTVTGSEDNPVFITALTDDNAGGDSNSDGDKTKPAGGYWRNISFEKGSKASLEHCIFRYAGNREEVSIICDDASPAFKQCTLESGMRIGVDCRAAAAPVLESVTITGHKYPVNLNGLQAMPAIKGCNLSGSVACIVKITGREITGDVTLPGIDYPYCFDESQVLKKGAKLTIEAGAVIKFRDRCAFTVEGELIAEGEDGNPIVFTSLLDDEYLGDSNCDRGIIPPNRGQWDCIRFSEGAKGVMKHCKILYAGIARSSTALLCVGASPELENCEIAYTNGSAIRIEGNSKPVLTSCGFHHNTVPLYVVNVDVFPVIKDCSFKGNRHNAVCIGQGTITKDINWSQALVPYLLDGDLTVDINAGLTLAPGVVVKMRSGRSLHIRGTLKAVGAEDNPITITSEFDDGSGGDTNCDSDATVPSRGAWHSINILKGSTVALEHCIVRYGGGKNTAAVACTDAAPVLSKTTIEGSQGFAARFDGKSAAKMTDCIIRRNGYTLYYGNLDVLPQVTGCKFEENTHNYLRMPAGKITEAVTWTQQPIPYVPDGSLTVDIGASLTLEPGVIYKFGANCELTVLGTLEAKGAADNRIYLTSIMDDTVGGDTNGDMDLSWPTPNYWRCIRFAKGSKGTLEHCVVMYGGAGRTAGIICDSASPTISSCEIGCCDTAITLLGDAAPRVGPGCKFGRCLGITFWNDTPNDIDAAGNDWGTDVPEEIADMIHDRSDDEKKGEVRVEPETEDQGPGTGGVQP